MDLQAGGVQVSDNAVAWGDGDVVLVVPSPGETVAPPGLGPNPYPDAVESPVLSELAAEGVSASRAGTVDGDVTTMDVQDCPSGITVKDYYCFYQYRDFGGRRVQFTGATTSADAADWGFNNGTSSWVSTDVDCTVHAFDKPLAQMAYPKLWDEPENSSSSFVGTANDNRMSHWTCQ